jgi:hypothetical protein
MTDVPDYAQGTNDSIHSFPGNSANPLPDVGVIGKLFTNLAESILKKVVLAIVGFVLPGPVIDQLSHWAHVLLPDFILQPIRDLINIIVSVLDLIPIIGPPAGDALEYFGQIFGVIKSNTDVAQATGENAQSSADTANVRISQLAGEVASGGIPGGLYFTDTFDRTGADLGSNYTQFDTGPAGGHLYPDGNNASIIPSGAGITECIAQLNSPSTTDYQTMSLVQDSAIRNILVAPLIRIILRENAARTESVVLTVLLNQVVVEKKAGGSTTTLASVSPHGNAAGDLWTFKAGTDNDVRELVVIHNTAEVIRVTDNSGTLHSVGASNRQASFTEQTGQSFAPPFFTNVEPPSAVQSITFYDRLPAA